MLDLLARLLERRALMVRGIGFVDVHLLASAALASPARPLDTGQASGESRG